LGQRDIKNYLELFDDSFHRVMHRTIEDKDLIQRFYEIFLSSSPEAAKKFEKTDMEVQKQLLRQSVSFMLSFSTTLKSSSHLKSIARRHSKSQVDIHPGLYDQWLNCFLKTVKEFDPEFDQEIELAWRVILSPGIAYMKYHYDKI